MRMRSVCVILVASGGLAMCLAGCTKNNVPQPAEPLAGAPQEAGGRAPTIPEALKTFSPEDRALLNTLILVAEADPEDGPPPLKVHLTVEADEELVRPRYAWDFGDGSPESHESEPTHVYATPGLYTVEVSIKDQATGKKGKDKLLVDVEEP